MTPAALILAPLLAWNPPQGARGTTPDEVLERWANAIAASCTTRYQCLMVGAIMSEESRFAPHILDGSCQSAAWRAAHPGLQHCDGGKAYGPGQIHAPRWATVSDLPPQDADPDEYARVMVRIFTASPRCWSTYALARADVDKWMREHP